MADRTSRIAKAYPIPTDVKPKSTWGRQFARGSGFAVNVHKKYWMSVFVDSTLSGPNMGSRRRVLSKPALLAHCVSCVGEVWAVHSEPVSKDAVGLIVYTAKGKALATGTGRLDRAGTFRFKLATLYKGITNAIKIDYKIEGKGKSDGSYEITGSVTVSDSR